MPECCLIPADGGTPSVEIQERFLYDHGPERIRDRPRPSRDAPGRCAFRGTIVSSRRKRALISLLFSQWRGCDSGVSSGHTCRSVWDWSAQSEVCALALSEKWGSGGPGGGRIGDGGPLPGNPVASSTGNTLDSGISSRPKMWTHLANSRSGLPLALPSRCQSRYTDLFRGIRLPDKERIVSMNLQNPSREAGQGSEDKESRNVFPKGRRHVRM